MIEAQGLTRRYGEFTAVQGITFSVPDGEILGMLVPNGGLRDSGFLLYNSLHEKPAKGQAQ